MDKPTILVTGGAGYIGAHVVRKLIDSKYRVVVLDNLSTGKAEHIHAEAIFVEGDFGDEELLRKVFAGHSIDAVMHFAASIEVGESVEKPLEYLENNTVKTNRLLNVMDQASIKKLIFSSTAAVYGLQEKMPISEDAATGPLDPYGATKLLTEQLIKFHSKFTGMNAIIFRYFNACGSDFDKTIYSQHHSHLIPIVADVAAGRQSEVKVFGDDYETIDGTGVRDYVHVLDIAAAHVVGLERLNTQKGVELYNIGTGIGLSVKQIIATAEAITGKKIPLKVESRRPGDTPITVADNSKIRHELSFELQHSDIETIIKTSLSE